MSAATAAATPGGGPDGELLAICLSFFMAAGNWLLLLASGGTGRIIEGLALELKAEPALAREREPPPAPAVIDFSALGLRLRLVAAVALFRVDMLGFPEDPCLGERVPKGDFGLFEAVLLLLLCLGLL